MSRIFLNLTGAGLLAAAVLILLRPEPQSARVAPSPEFSHPAKSRNAVNETVYQSESISREHRPDFPAAVETRGSAFRERSASDPLTSRSVASPQIVRRSHRPLSRFAHTGSPEIAGGNPDESRQMAGSVTHEAAPHKEPDSKSDDIPLQSPAVLLEIDDPRVSHPEAKERLAAVATGFSTALTGSGLDGASPEYRELWNRERILAETRFRSMYGGQAWMNHHIQSHHAQAGPASP
jgi:hypothetical protein